MSDSVSGWERKSNPRLWALWARVSEPDRAGHSVGILVRFTGPVEVLQKLGMQVHSVAGDIASGTIALSDLPEVADASQVVFVEMAQRLMLD